MKNILTLSGVMLLVVLGLSSCYKKNHCVCEIKTVTLDTRDTVKSTNTHHVIKGTKFDAEEACKYYETEEDYLGRPAYIYHDCKIVDNYDK